MSESAGHVLVHCRDSAADFEAALETARTINRKRPALQVQVIINGPALDAVAGTEPVEKNENIRVTACETGMAVRGINVGDLRPGIDTVDSAAVALAEGQLAGAAYLRA